MSTTRSFNFALLVAALLTSQAMASDFYVIGGTEQRRGAFGGSLETLRTMQSLEGAKAAMVSREGDAIVALDAQGRFITLGTTLGDVVDAGVTADGAVDMALAGQTYYVLHADGVSTYVPPDRASAQLLQKTMLPNGAHALAVRELPSGTLAVWIAGPTEVRRIDVPTQGGAFVKWAVSLSDIRDIAAAADRQGRELTIVLTSTEARVYLDQEEEVSLHGSTPVTQGTSVAASPWNSCQGTWCVDAAVTTGAGELLAVDLDRMIATPAASGIAITGFPVLVWGMSSQKFAMAATDESGDPHTARVQLIAPVTTGIGWDLPGYSGRRVDVGDVWGADSGGPGDGITEIVESVYSRGPNNTTPDHLAIWRVDGSGALAKVATAQPYGTYTFGGTVAAGNVTFDAGDATQGDEILTGPGPGSMHGPQVRAFSASSGAILPLAKVNYYAYGTLRYGVNVAAHGGAPPQFWLTGPGPGTVFGPHVRGWSMATGQLAPIAGINFFAYNTLRYGVEPDQGDFDRNEAEDIIVAPGPGFVFAAQVRGFSWNWGPTVRTIPSINLFLSDGAGKTGYYGARAAFVDATDGSASYQVAGSIGSDPAISYPNARLLDLNQTPAATKDMNTGWTCTACALYLGSNMR